MWLSDISVKRPVFATVINLIIVAFGIVAFLTIPLREYPDIDPPVISIDTTYKGAAANVVETRLTVPIEDRIAGVEGIRNMTSTSQDGRSRISIEFAINRDIDDAANDIRDRIAGILDNLPVEADPPEVEKADSNDDVMMWLNLTGQGMDIMEITDYARRYVVDRFSTIDGVARVRVGGAQDKAMRIWLDSTLLASYQLTVGDVEQALNNENIELPAGTIEAGKKDFTVRMMRQYHNADDFRSLIITRDVNGHLVRLGDVATVDIEPVEKRTLLRGNGLPMVGIGIIKQAQANTISVARLAKEQMHKVNSTLPSHMKMKQSYDTSVFIEYAIYEVYKTLAIAIILVVLVIYLFLGNARAMLVPALTVPVSLVGTFIVLSILGFTINLLTLLALVLAIGLVVDDAIVVLENIHRRIEMGEPRLVAAFRGARQVGFAVIATTLVLVAVFLPITLIDGDVGRLFTEFAVTIAVAVLFSSFVALTLSPMVSSKLLDKSGSHNALTCALDRFFVRLTDSYQSLLKSCIKHGWVALIIVVAMIVSSVVLFRALPQTFVPKEDRGAFFMFIKGPEGASYDYIMRYVDEIERRLMPFAKSGEFQRLLLRAPGSFGSASSFNDAIGIVVLQPWGNESRKHINHYVAEVRKRTSDIPGVRVFPVLRQPLGGGTGRPVQFVISGGSYEELANWRDSFIAAAQKNKLLLGLDHDYKETKPQLGLDVIQPQTADLGVSAREINSALETLFGTKRSTTFIQDGEEYDVILEIKKSQKQTAENIRNIYVRSDHQEQLIPLANMVNVREFADAGKLNRYNRLRSITFEASLAPGYTLGEALTYLEELAKEELPAEAIIGFKGASLDYKESSSSIYFVWAFALIVVFLVLSAQFESFVHATTIILTVPLAITGGLFALWLTGQTINIYSQIALIILVGLAAKNGILIVEFINQLRDEGAEFADAIIQASSRRLRPIIMTGMTTVMGSVPLILAYGAGAETRFVIGVVIFAGVTIAMVFTIFMVPMTYSLIARATKSPQFVTKRLSRLLKEHEHKT